MAEEQIAEYRDHIPAAAVVAATATTRLWT
nr:MAG TPA_asm: hypothetical protein [Caudoviricetes sp.]